MLNKAIYQPPKIIGSDKFQAFDYVPSKWNKGSRSKKINKIQIHYIMAPPWGLSTPRAPSELLQNKIKKK